MPTAIELLEAKTEDLLDALQAMAEQHCHTESKDHPDYPGRTDSGAITANAEALSMLAEHGRFRITGGFGRVVLGYWPDNDPEPPSAGLSGRPLRYAGE